MITKIHKNGKLYVNGKRFYTTFDTQFVTDQRLSHHAKLILLYIGSQSETWGWNDYNIYSTMKMANNTFYKAKKELINTGYVSLTKVKKSKTIDYIYVVNMCPEIKESQIKESIIKESLNKESLNKESIIKESIIKESLNKESIIKESLNSDTNNNNIIVDKLNNDNPNNDNFKKDKDNTGDSVAVGRRPTQYIIEDDELGVATQATQHSDSVTVPLEKSEDNIRLDDFNLDDLFNEPQPKPVEEKEDDFDVTVEDIEKFYGYNVVLECQKLFGKKSTYTSTEVNTGVDVDIDRYFKF